MFLIVLKVFLVASLLLGAALTLAQVFTLHRGALFSGAAEEGVEWLIATRTTCIGTGLLIVLLSTVDLAACF